MSVTISSEGRLKVQQLMTVSPSPTPLNTAASSPVEKGPTEKDDVFPPIRLPPHRGVGKLEFQSTDFPVATVKDKYRYLALYFTLNLVLTLYNKAIMGVFPYPYLLTAIHAGSSSIGCQILFRQGFFTLPGLSVDKYMVLAAFSVLYTLNIAISNVSLNLVTVPFHQVVRALTPIFTIAINAVFFQQNYGKMTYLSLIPVISGVGLATFGDYYYTEAGLLLTLLGTFFAALKTVATNRIQTGFSMHLNAFEILYHMSPLAFFQSLIYSYLSGELYRFEMTDSAHYTFSAIISTILILGINGFLAFILNYVSFTANKKTGALTMTVAANIKQILTILTSVIFFELQMGWLNMVGIFLTLLGGAWYAKVELEAKALRA